MKAGWVGNRRLQALVKNGGAMHVPEVVEIQDAHVKDLFDDWDAGSVSGSALILRSGGATIFPVDTEIVEDVPNDGAFLTALTDVAPYEAVLITWTDAGAEDLELHSLVARLDPRRDNGQPKTVAYWEAELFRVVRVLDESAGGGMEFAMISRSDRIAASGDAPANFTFSFGSPTGGYPRVGPPPDRGDQLSSYPLTLVRIIGLRADGTPADNVGWLADTNGSPVSGTGYTATTVGVSPLNNPQALETGGAVYQVSAGGHYPEFSLNQSEYSSVTITFGGAEEVPDLPGSGELVIVARGETPSDSSITYEISDDGSTWVECVDGDVVGEDNTADGGKDLSGVSTTGPWDLRVTLTPSTAANLNAPTVREFGVERVVSTILRGGAATFSGGSMAVDAVTLKGNVAAAELAIAKTGENDFRDYGSKILSRSHIGQMTVRIWLADVDGLQLHRHEWMLDSAWDVDDYTNTGTHHVLALISPLRRIHSTIIPPFVVTDSPNPGDGRRRAEEVAGTLRAVYEEILDTFLAVATRFRGPGIEDDVNTVSKRLTRSRAKEELDRLAYLDGSAIIASQGRICARKVLRDGPGGDTPVAFFPHGSYTPLEIGPGFSSRTDEFFVRYNWNEATESFEDERRYVNSVALDRLGGVGVHTTQELDEETCRWIASETLADLVGRRVPHHFATGQIIWRIRSYYAHPELEIGDCVAISTTRFVGRSPLSEQEITGRVWARAIVVGVGDTWGRELELWVPSFDRIVVLPASVARQDFMLPGLLHLDATSRSHTGDTNWSAEQTFKIPPLRQAGSFAARVKGVFVLTGSGGMKNVAINYRGVTAHSVSSIPSGDRTVTVEAIIRAAGATTFQSTFLEPLIPGLGGIIDSPQDVSTPADVTFEVQLANAGDTATLVLSEIQWLGKIA